MIISPQEAIENGWVTGFTSIDKQLQPNAIDFTLDTLSVINNENRFIINENGKQHRGCSALTPVPNKQASIACGEQSPQLQRFWTISPGAYDIASNVYVEVPQDVAVMLIIRSTFNRNGLFLISGLYDTGFKGHIGAVLYNFSGVASIGQGTRVGQVMFLSGKSVGQYAGGYNHNMSEHWADGVPK